MFFCVVIWVIFRFLEGWGGIFCWVRLVGDGELLIFGKDRVWELRVLFVVCLCCFEFCLVLGGYLYLVSFIWVGERYREEGDFRRNEGR